MHIEMNSEKEPVSGVSKINELFVDFSTPFKINEIFVKPKAKTPVDKHQVAEFWHILSGNGNLFYRNEEHLLKEGDWFFFYPYEPHQVENTGFSELKILSLYWK